MTIRNFWFAFFVYVMFFAGMVLSAFTLGRASTVDTSGYTREELFLLDMQTIPARSEAPYFALMPQKDYEDFEALMKEGQPNLVVRATFTSRGGSRVYDPFGYYSNADLGGDNAAHLYISTVYSVKIEEVILGDPEQFSDGDTFTFYAPYGAMKDFAVRYEDTPIFTAGREYFLFFSVLDVSGVGRWYDLTHPSAAAQIMIEDERTFNAMSYKGADLFDDTGYDSEDLYTMVKALYEESPYSLEVPRITPMDGY